MYTRTQVRIGLRREDAAFEVALLRTPLEVVTASPAPAPSPAAPAAPAAKEHSPPQSRALGVEPGAGMTEVRICTSCGKTLKPRDVFCTGCGKHSGQMVEPANESASLAPPRTPDGNAPAVEQAETPASLLSAPPPPEGGLARAGIGIMLQPVLPDLTEMVVTRIIPGGAAHASNGIFPGDVITHVNDAPAFGWDLTQMVSTLTGPDGTTVRVGLRRAAADGSVTTPTLELLRRRAPTPAFAPVASLDDRQSSVIEAPPPPASLPTHGPEAEVQEASAERLRSDMAASDTGSNRGVSDIIGADTRSSSPAVGSKRSGRRSKDSMKTITALAPFAHVSLEELRAAAYLQILGIDVPAHILPLPQQHPPPAADAATLPPLPQVVTHKARGLPTQVLEGRQVLPTTGVMTEARSLEPIEETISSNTSQPSDSPYKKPSATTVESAEAEAGDGGGGGVSGSCDIAGVDAVGEMKVIPSASPFVSHQDGEAAGEADGATPTQRARPRAKAKAETRAR